MRYAKAFDPPLHLQLLPLTSETDVVQAQARNLWRAVAGAQLELASGRWGSATAAEHRDLDQLADNPSEVQAALAEAAHWLVILASAIFSQERRSVPLRI